MGTTLRQEAIGEAAQALGVAAPTSAVVLAWPRRLPASAGARASVLIELGEADDRFIVKAVLEDAGHGCTLSEQVWDDLTVRPAADVVVIDWRPPAEGLSRLLRLRAQGNRAPMVAILGESQDADRPALPAEIVSCVHHAHSLACLTAAVEAALAHGPVTLPLLDHAVGASLRATVGVPTFARITRAAIADLANEGVRCLAALERGAGKEVRRAAHALKGLGALTGAALLHVEAAALERAAVGLDDAARLGWRRRLAPLLLASGNALAALETSIYVPSQRLSPLPSWA